MLICPSELIVRLKYTYMYIESSIPFPLVCAVPHPSIRFDILQCRVLSYAVVWRGVAVCAGAGASCRGPGEKWKKCDRSCRRPCPRYPNHVAVRSTYLCASCENILAFASLSALMRMSSILATNTRDTSACLSKILLKIVFSGLCWLVAAHIGGGGFLAWWWAFMVMAAILFMGACYGI